MEPERWNRVQQLFYEAEALAPEQQQAFLVQACAGQESLCKEVLTLLNCKPDGLLEDAVLRAVADTSSETPALPAEIGGYRILQQLGEGGMGVVYEAEQLNPRRRVAIKIIRYFHLAGKRSHQLFQREADALGRLKHPGIATIYESSAAEGKVPFIAMELVTGLPLGDWVQSLPVPSTLRKESLGAQLRVFRQVCEAIIYAHQNGVIHRDLKPTNILVSQTDGAAELVKVLDFGLARILERDDDGREVTEAGIVQGTVAFMSPEQALGASDQIDVRTDIYSLGVILYWMLTRHHPYLNEKVSLAESLQSVLRQPPARLSRWFSRWDADLEVILLKALEKERERRYQNVSIFLGDIDRYLENLPILARPPNAVYQLRKLVQRHRAVFAVLACLVTLTIGFTINAVIQSSRIRVQRDRANQEAATARQVSDFMLDLFRNANPLEAGSPLTASDLLRTGKERASRLLQNQPELRARLLDRIADAYDVIGPQSEARAALQESIRIRAAAFGVDGLASATSWNGLSTTEYNDGNYPAAVQAARHALKIRERYLSSTDPQLAEVLDNLASALLAQGKLEEAEAQSRRAIEIDRLHPETNRVARSSRLASFGNVLREQSNYAAAIPELRQAVELASQAPDGEGQMAYNLNALAVALGLSGNPREAEQAYRRDLELVRRVYGPHNMNIGMLLSNIADCLNIEGRHAEAEVTALKALAAFDRDVGSNHPRRADILQPLGDALEGEGRTAEAGKRFRERFDICRHGFGEENIATIRASIRFAEWEARYGSPARALERVAANKQHLSKDPRSRLTTDWGMNKRAEGYVRQAVRDIAGSKEAFGESVSVLTRTLGPSHWQTKAASRALANLPE